MNNDRRSTSDPCAATNVVDIFTRAALALPPQPLQAAPVARLGAECQVCGQHAYPQELAARVREYAEQLLQDRYPRTRTVEAAIREQRHQLRKIVALSKGCCPDQHAEWTLEFGSYEENMLYNDAVRRRRARKVRRAPGARKTRRSRG